MLPAHRSTSATRSTLTSSTLARAASSGTSGGNPTVDVSAALKNTGGSLLVSMDASNRENLLGRQGSSALLLEDGTVSEDADTADSRAADTSDVTSADKIAASNPALDKAIKGMQQNLQSLADDPEAFHAALTKSFGDNYDKGTAENIRQQTLAGDFSWMPNIKVVDASSLTDQSGRQGGGTGLGAYSAATNTIYISADLLTSDPAEAISILTEEVGHSLDAMLNTTDAAGDEGDIFARIVGGEEISATELTALKAENDSGTILVDGKEVEVEYGFGSFVKKIGKSVKGAVRDVVETVGGSKAADLFDKVQDAVKDVGRSLEKAAKKILENPYVAAIMSVAQYIPFTAAVATVYNTVRAAYQVAQGIKNGSMSMVLGAVAGVAGGAANLGGAFGASQGFVDGAARVSDIAGKASQAYRAASAKDFSSALAIGAELFQGTSTGTVLSTAQQASSVRDAVRSGDYVSALAQGSALANSLGAGQQTGALIGDITNHVQLIDGLVSTVKDGNYTAAAAGFITQYGDQLGLDDASRKNILQVAQGLETAGELRVTLRSGNYATALRSIAAESGLPLDEGTLTMLETSLNLRDGVRGENFPAAARSAAALATQSGHLELAARFDQMANLLSGGSSSQPVFVKPASVAELATQGA